MSSTRIRYLFIFLTCIAAGTAQGLLLPLLSQILEARGVPSALNGLQSSLLYFGTIMASPFMIHPVRRFGYKPVIWSGALLVAIGYALFPVFDSIVIWAMLRLLVGVGLAALHYAAQLWIQTTTPSGHRGKMITLYGMCYGIGFGIGPLGLNLMQWGLWVPFVFFALFLTVFIGMISTLKNDYPEPQEEKTSISKNIRSTWMYGYLGLIPAIMYGFMEAGLVSSLPIVGHRTGLSPSLISLCLSTFVVGSIILQLPLGWLSDRYGRKPVIFLVTFIGGGLFFLTPLFLHNDYLIIALFTIIGALLGSIFSLGMVLATDLIPKSLLPNAGVITSVGFGIASMSSPNLMGWSIEYVSPLSLFYIVGGAFVVYSLLLASKGLRDSYAAERDLAVATNPLTTEK